MTCKTFDFSNLVDKLVSETSPMLRMRPHRCLAATGKVCIYKFRNVGLGICCFGNSIISIIEVGTLRKPQLSGARQMRIEGRLRHPDVFRLNVNDRWNAPHISHGFTHISRLHITGFPPNNSGSRKIDTHHLQHDKSDNEHVQHITETRECVMLLSRKRLKHGKSCCLVSIIIYTYNDVY